MTFWQSALSGGESRLQVAQDFVNGQEVSARLMDSFYADFLRRSTDPATQAMVTSLVQGTNSVESTALNILASDEFFALSGAGG